MRPLFVPGEQRESFSHPRDQTSHRRRVRGVDPLRWGGSKRATSARPLRSTIRQFVAWRSVKGRDGEKARITGHIDQDFQPHGHDAPFPELNSARAVSVPAPCDDQTCPIAWLDIARTLVALQTKTPPTSEDADGVFRAFTSRKVACTGKKTSRHRLRSCLREILSAEFSCVPLAVFWRKRRSKFLLLNARTNAGWFHLSRWPRSSRNTLCARVRTSAGFP